MFTTLSTFKITKKDDNVPTNTYNLNYSDFIKSIFENEMFPNYFMNVSSRDSINYSLWNDINEFQNNNFVDI